MNVNITKNITLNDDTEVSLELEGQFVNGGIGAYEFWGAKGYDSHPELDNIVCENIDDFTPEQQSQIEEMISSGDFDSEIWDKFNQLA